MDNAIADLYKMHSFSPNSERHLITFLCDNIISSSYTHNLYSQFVVGNSPFPILNSVSLCLTGIFQYFNKCAIRLKLYILKTNRFSFNKIQA